MLRDKNEAAAAKTRVCITDKDFTERACFKEVFRLISLQLCLFHVLRTFRREITCEKFKINSNTETTTVVGALKRKGKMCIFEQKTLSKKKKLIFESILNKEAFLKFKNEGKNIFSKDNLKKTLPSKLMDQNFFDNVKIFKDHFTFDTFDFIEKFHFNKKIKWKCTSCLTNLENKNSVGCDGCFDWHHLECAFLSAPPNENFWFCEKCK